MPWKMKLNRQNLLLVDAQQQLVLLCRYFPSTRAIIQCRHLLESVVSSGMATNLNKVPKLSKHDKSRMEFKLPEFSPDIEKCIRKDAFYTSAQRNKLIHEACRALQGYCREQDCPVSNDDKRLLAHLLYDR